MKAALEYPLQNRARFLRASVFLARVGNTICTVHQLSPDQISPIAGNNYAFQKMPCLCSQCKPYHKKLFHEERYDEDKARPLLTTRCRRSTLQISFLALVRPPSSAARNPDSQPAQGNTRHCLSELLASFSLFRHHVFQTLCLISR